MFLNELLLLADKISVQTISSDLAPYSLASKHSYLTQTKGEETTVWKILGLVLTMV